MHEIRKGNPNLKGNVGPYLRNRYYEMREIPYKERTQQQRNEKNRLIQEMIHHGISLPSSDSDSSFDGIDGNWLGYHTAQEFIKNKIYSNRARKSDLGDEYINDYPTRKSAVLSRYRDMGYSEKRASRGKYFSRIANEKSQAASKNGSDIRPKSIRFSK